MANEVKKNPEDQHKVAELHKPGRHRGGWESYQATEKICAKQLDFWLILFSDILPNIGLILENL